MPEERPVSRQRDSSRRRYEAYQNERRARTERGDAGPHGTSAARPRTRERSFWQLLREFLRLLGPQRSSVIFALATVTVATLLKLFPPAATKVVIDYVLGDVPLP